MAVPVTIVDLSVTEASNVPPDSETITPTTRPSDYLRAHATIIRREQAQFTAVASATTVDLGAIATGNYGHITGTTTITSFGTVAAGIERTLVFDGILTLTHNATSLILRTGANRTTAAGDVGVYVSEGSGNWREVSYHKAETVYQTLDATLTALAGLATGADTFPYFTGIDTASQTSLTAFARTLLDDADAATARATLGVKTLQVVHFDTGAVATGTTLIPFDDTIPQQTEGDQYMSLAITPIASTSTLVIDVVISAAPSATTYVTTALFRDTAADSVGAVSSYLTANYPNSRSFSVKVSAGSVAATTFKVRIGPHAAATITFNGQAGGRFLGGVMASSIRITEIAA